MSEKKEYRSALRSRRLIHQAFQELLQEKPLKKITVTDIVTRADINRSTFYAHYPDVRGLIEEMMNDIITHSIDLINQMDILEIFQDPIPFLSALISFGNKNIELYKLLEKSDCSYIHLEEMKAMFFEKAISEETIPLHIRQSSTYRIRVSFFIGGILNAYIQWLKGELPYSIDAVAWEVGKMLQSPIPSSFTAEEI